MPSNGKLITELQQSLSDPGTIGEKAFVLLKDLSVLVSAGDNQVAVQELVLRALEHRAKFGESRPLLDALVRRIGLFPYLEPKKLPVADQLAYEFHRPRNMEESIVFHRPQALVYRALLDGGNVVLSAPASFGKSLIIDAVIASERYKNIMVVVPTIALIDETRRRLSQRFGQKFKIITHFFQEREASNIYILTQERVLELSEKDIDTIEFFVIDEFYKLTPGRDDDDRCFLLNEAFYRLAKKDRQFYMLGPGIEGLSPGFREQANCLFFYEPYATVVSELHSVEPGEDDFATLISLCKTMKEPTMIFCSSPRRASEVARRLTAVVSGQTSQGLKRASDWIAKHYHPEWHFGRALERGIGVHHGRIPRALAQYVVRQFNDDKIRFLVCTSTLIEGVNTKAKNIIVFDDRINRSPIDLFTFNNIRGRSGRMFQHFVGHVYLFHTPPETGLPFVDVPVYSQPNDAPTSLLIQLEDGDLTTASKSRLDKYAGQEVLRLDTLRKNHGVDIESQLSIARLIASEPSTYHQGLHWTHTPDYGQLTLICELIWVHFGGQKLGSGSVRSIAQLVQLLTRLRSRPTMAQLIDYQIPYCKGADDTVQRTMDFVRLWAMFNFPRLLRAIDGIQKEVFERAGLPAGNYEFYASAIENLFLDRAIVALDEYGIPLELARKLETRLQPNNDLDTTLKAVKNLKGSAIADLSPFEKELIAYARESI